MPFSVHYVTKLEPKLQYKGGFCLRSLITASKVWHAYTAKCWDYYGFKMSLPLDFHLQLSPIPVYFSFLHLYFFDPSITRLFLRKYSWPWVVEQDFHQNFLDRSTLHGLHDCAHFLFLLNGLKDLTNALCKVVCDYTSSTREVVPHRWPLCTVHVWMG